VLKKAEARLYRLTLTDATYVKKTWIDWFVFRGPTVGQLGARSA
jgi:hypothetical protein